jgi:hypothetical protein
VTVTRTQLKGARPKLTNLMNTTTMSRSLLSDKLVNLAAPLLALVLLSSRYGVGVGASSTIWAAVLVGAVVPTLSRFVTVPFLKFCGIDPGSVTGWVFLAVCNLGAGAACFMATLPATLG